MSHLLDPIKNSVTIQAALKGIRPAVIGMIFTAAIVVGKPHSCIGLVYLFLLHP